MEAVKEPKSVTSSLISICGDFATLLWSAFQSLDDISKTDPNVAIKVRARLEEFGLSEVTDLKELKENQKADLRAVFHKPLSTSGLCCVFFFSNF
jgi:hypothetical protein